ncbi:hypothetical protein ACFLXJ_03670 [Chloroflexota bacterium]
MASQNEGSRVNTPYGFQSVVKAAGHFGVDTCGSILSVSTIAMGL